MTTLDISPFEEHLLPDGTVIHYRDSDHSYWSEVTQKKDGTLSGKGRLTGVSTVSNPFDWEADPLISWGARLENQGVSELVRRDLEAWQQSGRPDDMGFALTWLESGETITQALRDNQLTWRDIRDRAADRGSAVHKHALHALSQGEQVAFEQLDDEQRGYAQGVTGFWLDHEPQVIAAEAVVADVDARVAGRFDLLCEIGGELVMVDAKTSKYLSPKFVVQISGYAKLAEACGYGAATSGAVLQVTAEGTYNLVRFALAPDAFDQALGVYREAAELRKMLRAARKEADSAD